MSFSSPLRLRTRQLKSVFRSNPNRRETSEYDKPRASRSSAADILLVSISHSPYSAKLHARSAVKSKTIPILIPYVIFTLGIYIVFVSVFSWENRNGSQKLWAILADDEQAGCFPNAVDAFCRLQSHSHLRPSLDTRIRT